MLIWVVSKTIPGESIEVWSLIKQAGHQVFVGSPAENLYVQPDIIISWGITSLDDSMRAVERWPNAKLYCYNWDVYEWVWTHPQGKEYDYNQHGELLKMADEVWVPSDCTGRRTLQWWPEVKSVHTILSAIPYWNYDNVRDDGYALCCLRKIPDPWCGMFEKCCDELNIPYKNTDHQLSQADYRDTVAGCRFICAPFYELSTGGFSLMEAHYIGKPVLLNDSEWNGGKDYMRERAWYFHHGDIEDFKTLLLHLYNTPVNPDKREECAEYIATEFSDKQMADHILKRIS